MRTTRRPQRGQAMVEFALVAPIFFLLVFGLVDFGRFVYTYAAISNATREGARLLSLAPQSTSDCVPIQRILGAGQGFKLVMDPRSVVDDVEANSTSDPNYATAGPTANPPLGTAYAYIWPAVAKASPPDSGTNCQMASKLTTRPISSIGVRDVEVQILYHFVPLTPVVSQITGPQGFTVKAISIVRTEY